MTMVLVLASMQDVFKGGFQIVIIASLIFGLYKKIFKGTRSAQMLVGIAIVLGGLSFVTLLFDFDVLKFLLGKLVLGIAFAFMVIFQPEIRQAFLTIGRRRFRIENDEVKDKVVDIVCTAAETLSMRRYGALIAIERNSHLLEYVKSGTELNAPIVLQLLTAIFYPNTPLHDGAVIIKGETIVAARCVLPLSATDVGRGMRHRAAIGLSERADAVVVVVSEETGSISIAFGGRLISNLSKELLAKYLVKLLHKEGLTDAIRRSFSEFESEVQASGAASKTTPAPAQGGTEGEHEA